MKKRKEIFWVFTALFLMAQGSWAMGEEDENKSIILCIKPALPESVSIIDDENYIEVLPDETLTHVFTFFNVDDLGRIAQVSSRWKRVASDPQLWREFGFRKYGDYLTEEDLRENPRKMVIQHYLSVLANVEKDLERISMLVQRYDLGSYDPLFKKNMNLRFLLAMMKNPSDREVVLAQDSSIVRGRETERFEYKWYNHRKEFNEPLVEKGNRGAIKRKIKGLKTGDYGYEKNPIVLREFIEAFVEKGDKVAIKAKIEGLANGHNGYEKKPVAAVELNEVLVKKGDQKAIGRKVSGLYYGENGYEKNPAAAVKFNDTLVKKGDQEAIGRKIIGLSRGYYGYERNSVTARELNETLVEKGNRGAIERKIQGFISEGDGSWFYGYKPNPAAAKELNEVLVEKGDEEAIERKIEGLSKGNNGYESNPATLREFLETLIEREGIISVERKIKKVGDKKWNALYDVNTLKFNKLFPERGWNYDYDILIKLKRLCQDKYLTIQYTPGHWCGLHDSFFGWGLGSCTSCRKQEFISVYQDNPERNPEKARAFIEDLVISDHSTIRAFGKYLKAFALKYEAPALGYEKDYEKAIAFIREHNVPF